MHIVFFEFVTSFGGAPRCVVELAERLKEHVDVSIVDPYGCCEPFAQAVRQAGVDYHVLCPGSGVRVVGGQGRPLLRAWRCLASLPDLMRVQHRAARLFERIKPSLISSNNFKSALVVGTSRSLRHVPQVIHLHGWYTPDMLPWYGRWLCSRRCSGVLSVSRATKAALICAGIPAGKIHVLHNPINVDAMEELSVRPLLAPLPQAHRPIRILCPGTVIRSKGHHTAVEAMPSILASGHDAVLWVAGGFHPSGPNRNYLNETKAIARRLGVADRVEWLGLRNDMPQVIRAATCAVVPTHTEGHPRVLLEIMALGCPVASTPVGGIMDMILPGVTGLLFDVDQSEGLALCVDKLVGDPTAAARMAGQARAFVRESFRPEQQIQQAVSLYERILRGPLRGGSLP